MDAMRETWTDARMDDLNGKVGELGRRMDNGFNRVDADLRALRVETQAEFVAVRSEMNERFGQVDKRLDAMQDRLDDIHRMMFAFCGVVTAALVGAVVTVATQI